MKKIAILCALCILASAALMIFGFAERPEVPMENPVYIALMTEDRGTDAMQFKQGAQLAADEENAELIFYSVAVNEPETEKLLYFLEQLKDIPFDGLILPLCPEEVLTTAASIAGEKQAKLLCLYEVDEETAPSIATDRRGQGRQIAESIGELRPEARSVTVYMDDTGAQRLMLEGLKEGLHNVSLDIADAMQPTSSDVLVSLSPNLTEALAYAAGKQSAVWGVDPGEARVTLLEDNYVLGLSMEMPYIRGYLAVRALGGEATSLSCPTRVVTKETMYTSENVKLVFPLIQ